MNSIILNSKAKLMAKTNFKSLNQHCTLMQISIVSMGLHIVSRGKIMLFKSHGTSSTYGLYLYLQKVIYHFNKQNGGGTKWWEEQNIIIVLHF
jgi:hypothetical protein